MKNFLYTTLFFCLFVACQTEVYYLDEEAMKNGDVMVTTTLNAFHHFDVNTRLLEDDIYKRDPEETKLTSRTLLLYGHNKELIYGPIHYNNDNMTFLLDREKLNEEYPQNILDSCFVCVVANVERDFITESNAATLDKLHNITYRLPDADQEFPSVRPDQKDDFKGFVMIGYSEKLDLYFDYSSGRTPNPLSVNVYLSHLFAKIVVELQVKSIQGGTEAAQFHLDTWQAFNLPRMAKLGAPNANEETQPFIGIQDSLFNTEPSAVVGGHNPAVGSNSLYFTFYMLEHKLNPGNIPGEEVETGATTPWQYPEGILDSEKQRYKPLWPTFRQHPAYIELKGTYTDHQQNDYNVTYSIYLGEDNYQNFYINRNSRLYNNIVIRGITNSDDREHQNSDGTIDENISIDHRVNVEREDYNIFVEREMLLDSHFEVRPLDVEIKNPAEGTYVELYFVEPNPTASGAYKRIKANDANYSWARMEHINYAVEGNMVYAPNGKRKYFTTSLLSELNGLENNGLSAIISNNSNNRVWIYVDENPNISTSGMRKIMLVADYYENNTLKSQTRYHFHQHDLFPVYYTDTENNREYRYLIEYYEEYLFNFDPKDNHGNTTDGMTWGPKEQISYEISAIEANKGDSNSLLVRFLQAIGLDLTGLLTNMRTAILKKAAIYYDFYDTHSGKVHTEKLLDVMGQKSGITLTDFPRSAAEYCYNKNHRTASGLVTDSEFNWYLPAISEIQHITAGAYSHFNVFQDKWYWSSQPSYYKGNYKLQFYFLWSNHDLGAGDYYFEDTERARATKTKYLGNDEYSYEGSEVTATSYAFTGTYKGSDEIVVAPQSGYKENEIVDPGSAREAGNQFRDKVNRVRAVRQKDSRAATGNPTAGWPSVLQ